MAKELNDKMASLILDYLSDQNHDESVYKLVGQLTTVLRKEIEGLKEAPPKYQKGMDGYDLTLLQTGYNQGVDDVLALLADKPLENLGGKM